MNEILGQGCIFLSLGIGLFMHGKVNHPAPFWLVGMLGGASAVTISFWGKIFV